MTTDNRLLKKKKKKNSLRFKDFSYQWVDQKQVCSNEQSFKSSLPCNYDQNFSVHWPDFHTNSATADGTFWWDQEEVLAFPS